METINFKDCSCKLLDKRFNLEQVDTHPHLDNWIQSGNLYEIDNVENQVLTKIQNNLKYRVDDWN